MPSKSIFMGSVSDAVEQIQASVNDMQRQVSVLCVMQQNFTAASFNMGQFAKATLYGSKLGDLPLHPFRIATHASGIVAPGFPANIAAAKEMTIAEKVTLMKAYHVEEARLSAESPDEEVDKMFISFLKGEFLINRDD